MNCPICGGRTRVKDTRHDPVDGSTYRERECKECGRIAYSKEVVAKADPNFHDLWKRSHRRGFVDFSKEA